MSDQTSNDMASLILKKEMETELCLMNSKKTQKDKLKKIKSLVATYSQAIEYYQSIDSDLYIDLNIRMQQFITKQDVLDILDNEVEILAQQSYDSHSSTDNSGLFGDDAWSPKHLQTKVSNNQPTTSGGQAIQKSGKTQLDEIPEEFNPYGEMEFENENIDSTNVKDAAKGISSRFKSLNR